MCQVLGWMKQSPCPSEAWDRKERKIHGKLPGSNNYTGLSHMCLLFHLNDLFDPVACLLRIKGNSFHCKTSRCQYLMIGVVNVVKAHFLENWSYLIEVHLMSFSWIRKVVMQKCKWWWISYGQESGFPTRYSTKWTLVRLKHLNSGLFITS